MLASLILACGCEKKPLDFKEPTPVAQETPATAQASPTPEAAMEPKYSSIRNTLFEKRCFACHSTGHSAERVPLEPLEDLLNSPRELVIPGNADESGLIIAVTRNDAKRMPLASSGFSYLTDDEIKTLKVWINNGAQP